MVLHFALRSLLYLYSFSSTTYTYMYHSFFVYTLIATTSSSQSIIREQFRPDRISIRYYSSNLEVEERQENILPKLYVRAVNRFFLPGSNFSWTTHIVQTDRQTGTALLTYITHTYISVYSYTSTIHMLGLVVTLPTIQSSPAVSWKKELATIACSKYVHIYLESEQQFISVHIRTYILPL